MSFVVDLSDGRQVRRHQDHLRVRHDVGLSYEDNVSSSRDHRIVPVMPENTDLSHEGLSRKTNMAPDGPSVQASSPAPVPGRETPIELRKSKRQHKPPDRHIVDCSNSS